MSLYRHYIFLSCIYLLLPAVPSLAATDPRTLALLPTIDQTGTGLGPELEKVASQFLTETAAFTVSYKNQSVPNYSEGAIAKVFDAIKTDCFSFVFIEANRISVFLFDSKRPKHFLTSHQLYGSTKTLDATEPPTNIRSAFQAVLLDLMAKYQKDQFQLLPGLIAKDTEKVREISSVSTTISKGADAQIGHEAEISMGKQASFGVGLNYVFPMVHYQYALNPYLALGITAILMDYSVPAQATLKGFGGNLTLNYYSEGNFEGFWVEAGSGLYALSLSNTIEKEDRTLHSLIAHAGWRWKWETGPNFGFGVGAQYLLGLKSDKLSLKASNGILPSIILEIAFLL